MIRIGLLVALAIMLVTRLPAQQGNPAVTGAKPSRGHGIAYYGKWVSAALAVTFTGLGAHEYSNSDDAFRQLLNTCRADAALCTLTPGGTYTSPASEGLYQTSLRYQRRARVRLLAGQASLLLAAGLFLADHGGRGNEPGNIPYPAFVVVEPRAGGARVGVRVKF